MEPEVGVFLFTGFLESGKTTFIKNALRSDNLGEDEKSALLVFEEGEEEYQEGYCLIADDASATRTDRCIGNVVDDIEHTQDARQQQHGNTQYQVPGIEQGIEPG